MQSASGRRATAAPRVANVETDRAAPGQAARGGILLGYRGHADWRDMSEYVVHFTADPEGGPDGYWPMMSILSQGRLEPGGPFGVAAALQFLGQSQHSVCMSEIPLDQLTRIVTHRSEYGIAFRQSFLIANGGARVWYVDEPSTLANCLRASIATQGGLRDPDAEIWQMTPFIEVVSDAVLFTHYEWEREWRVPGGLSFQPSDVAFLFVPESLHAAASSFFAQVKREHLGPSYACPLLDAGWPEDRLQETFAAVTI